MSAPARSLAAWSVYAFSVGLLLLVVPNFLLGLFQIEETSESWVRVLGSTVILLAIYYVYIVRIAIADALGTAWTQFSLRNFTPVTLRR